MPFVMFHCSDVPLGPKFPFVPILVDVWTEFHHCSKHGSFFSQLPPPHQIKKKKKKQQSCDVPPAPATLTADLAGYGSAKSFASGKGGEVQASINYATVFLTLLPACLSCFRENT